MWACHGGVSWGVGHRSGAGVCVSHVRSDERNRIVRGACLQGVCASAPCVCVCVSRVCAQGACVCVHVCSVCTPLH